MAENEPQSGFDTTVSFLEEAISYGAHNNPPLKKMENNFYRRHPGIWHNSVDMTLLYFFNPGETLQTLADVYGITRERLRQKVERTIADLWGKCPESMREKYPLDELSGIKPVTLAQRQKLSHKKGGLSAQVYELLAQGRSLDEILAITHISTSQLDTARRHLRSWGGPELPLKNQAGPTLARQLSDQELDYQHTQDLLDQVRLSFYRTYAGGENPLLVKFRDLLRQCGICQHFQVYPAATEILSGSQIAVGIFERLVKSGSQEGAQRYYFIAAKDLQEAKTLLSNNPKLDKYRSC